MVRGNATYAQWSVILSCLCVLTLTPGAAGQTGGGAVPNWKGANGPIDLKLQDPVLVGAIDMHAHLDPDISGGGQLPRAMDAIDMAQMAGARRMRGFVYKTHMDVSSAASAYLARKARQKILAN